MMPKPSASRSDPPGALQARSVRMRSRRPRPSRGPIWSPVTRTGSTRRYLAERSGQGVVFMRGRGRRRTALMGEFVRRALTVYLAAAGGAAL